MLILAFIMGTSYYAGAETMEKLADIEIIVGDKKAEGIIYNTNAGKMECLRAIFLPAAQKSRPAHSRAAKADR